jgi:transmembrane sensor
MEPMTQEEKRRAAERAAEWLYALQDEGAAEFEAFTDWIRESPLHLKEFLFMSALDGGLGKMDPQRRLRIETLLAGAATNVVQLAPAAPTKPAASKRSTPWIAAAAAVTAVAVFLGWWLTSGEQTYETAAGELRAILLADGTSVRLHMKSRIRVRLSDAARDVTLLEGEAMFKVAHDPNRPFRVHTGSNVTQAVGTQFNVKRRPSGIIVSVLEGKVQISSEDPSHAVSMVNARPAEDAAVTDVVADGSITRLAAGEEVRIGNDGRIERRAAIDAQSTAALREQPLVFRDEPLEDIAAEFNRYNRQLQIVVEGNAARARRYTAVFAPDDPRSLLQFLEEADDLDVEMRGDELIIRERLLSRHVQ